MQRLLLVTVAALAEQQLATTEEIGKTSEEFKTIAIELNQMINQLRV